MSSLFLGPICCQTSTTVEFTARQAVPKLFPLAPPRSVLGDSSAESRDLVIPDSFQISQCGGCRKAAAAFQHIAAGCWLPPSVPGVTRTLWHTVWCQLWCQLVLQSDAVWRAAAQRYNARNLMNTSEFSLSRISVQLSASLQERIMSPPATPSSSEPEVVFVE